MSVLSWLPPVLSTLFRLAVYIFLRVIPTTLWKKVLPPLYFSYIASSFLISPDDDATNASTHEKAATKSNPVGPRDALRTLLYSLHSPSRSLRLMNLLINTVLVFAVADFLIAPFVDTASDLVFTRVGSVYPDSIKVVARYPHSNDTESGSIRVIYRQVDSLDSDAWKDGPVMNFTKESDWVDTVTLGSLWPSTSYEYTLRASNETPISHPIQFRTFPDPRLPTGHRFRFVVSSCITPNFPYRGPLHRRSIKGFDLLTDYLFSRNESSVPQPSETEEASNASIITPAASTETPPPVQQKKSEGIPFGSRAEFLLFLGDFIYADVPIYVGDDKEAYRQLYRRNYQSNSFRKLYEKLPVFFTYDDHEFVNNFGGEGNDSKPPYPSASDAFEIYNSNANYDPPTPGEHYYDFRYGDVAFFVMDTRRYRSKADDDISSRTMLGDAQLTALHTWLSRVNETSTFKFVVSSVPFTSLWTHDAQYDSWAGFPAEKAVLLEALHSVPNVMILSGDRHEFAAIEFNSATPGHHSVREFSTSPLSMFYVPFVRTLRMQSDALVTRKQTNVVVANGTTEVVTTYEDIPQERVLKYLPIGNHKWSALEVDTTDPKKPILRLEVMIDGKPAYHAEFVGLPVALSPSTALGALVPGGIKEMLNKFGMNPGKWF